MNNYKNPIEIDFESLLKCDNEKLSEIFNFYFKAVVLPGSDEFKEEAHEFLQLMGGAPELRERIIEIRTSAQKTLEEKKSEIDIEYNKIQTENSKVKKWLDQLKQNHEWYEKELDKKRDELEVITGHLNQKRKLIEKMSSSEIKQLIKRAQELKARIKEEKKEHENTLVQWRSKKEQILNLIKSFCGGSRGAVFSKSAPLAAGGKENESQDID